MDYNTHTQTYRMLDHWLPYETGVVDGTTSAANLGSTVDHSLQGRKKKNKQELSKEAKYEQNIIDAGSALWRKEVACTVARWNDKNGLGNAGLIAVGTASGMVRVENLSASGRWFKGSIKYGSVSALRFEGGFGQGEGGVSDSD